MPKMSYGGGKKGYKTTTANSGNTKSGKKNRYGNTPVQKKGSLTTMYEGYPDARPENKDRNQSAK